MIVLDRLVPKGCQRHTAKELAKHKDDEPDYCEDTNDDRPDRKISTWENTAIEEQN